MHEREPGENSNERMADRPPRDDATVETEIPAIVDTAPDMNEPAAIDDV